MLRTFAVLLVLALAPIASRAEEGFVLSHQGMLLDERDERVNRAVSMTFALYPAADSLPTDAVWSDTFDVQVAHGTYSVLLGDVRAGRAALSASDFEGPRWLGVRIGTAAEMKPRLRLGAVANALYAQRAASAATADTAASASRADSAASADVAISLDQAARVQGSQVVGRVAGADVAHGLAADVKVPAAQVDGLAAVARSGSYADLAGRPELAAIATSGSWNDLANRPALAPVATSGEYADLKNRPSLDGYVTRTGNTTFPGTIGFGGSLLLPTASPGTCAAGLRGAIWFDTTAGALRACNGTAWVSFVQPVGTRERPGLSCNGVRLGGGASGDGLYWIDPNGGDASDAFLAYCDMTTDGGGWTLLMTTSSTSAYTYSHAVWTAASAPSNDPPAGFDQDYVSPAFYSVRGTESMLCLGGTNCAAWDHASSTARALANGARAPGAVGAASVCTTFKCGPNTLPAAMRAATAGSTSGTWHRWGYVNDVNAWGTKTRVGFTGDGDSSDSSDTVIGLGLSCENACLGGSVTGAAHGRGAGYYAYTAWATPPLDGERSAMLLMR